MREPRSTSAPSHDGLATLDALLESALALAKDLAKDELFSRLLHVFAEMPAGDRETVVSVLEREVEYRRLTQGTSDVATGFESRPNPNARIYLRVVTTESPPPLMDLEELTIANHRGLRVLRYVLGSIHETWRQAMLTAARMLGPDERANARQVLAETIACLDAAERAP